MIRALSLAAMLTAATAAQANELPVYEEGQAFIFDNGRVERVESVDGDRITWAARSGRTYVRNANPVVPILEWSYRGQAGSRRIVGDTQALWPLEAGGSVQFRAINETRDEDNHVHRTVHMWTCTVHDMHAVLTPAGSFNAYPIVCDRYSASSMRVVERVTWQYAPDVGHYVQRESRNMRDGDRDVFSLYAALSPDDANPTRIETLAQQARDANESEGGED